MSKGQRGRVVSFSVSRYQASVPWPAGKFERYDMFAGEFPLSCLNRLRLRGNRQMVDLAGPSAALQFAGTLVNPIARFAARP